MKPSERPEQGELQGSREERMTSSLAVGLVLGWKIFQLLASLLTAVFGSESRPVRAMMRARVPQQRRSSDRNLEPSRATQTHQRTGSFFVSCTFLMSLAAAVGFLFVYWTGGSNLLLGVTLALFFGLLGVALVLYSHWLMPSREAVEPREEMPSPADVRDEFKEDFDKSVDEIHRRKLLKWVGVGAVGMIAAIFVSLIRSLGRPPGPSLFARVWKRGQRLVTLDGKPVSVNTLEPGSFVLVFPEDSIGDERAQTILIRVKPHQLQLPAERADWAPEGHVAYSRVCTHAGCPVGLFETTTCMLLCPCHQSTFDVLRGAGPTAGPAARPLPQLPLYADADGTLRAGGEFTEPPGPGFWEMPKLGAWGTS